MSEYVAAVIKGIGAGSLYTFVCYMFEQGSPPCFQHLQLELNPPQRPKLIWAFDRSPPHPSCRRQLRLGDPLPQRPLRGGPRCRDWPRVLTTDSAETAQCGLAARDARSGIPRGGKNPRPRPFDIVIFRAKSRGAGMVDSRMSLNQECVR